MAVDGLLRGAGDMKMFTVANLVNLGIRVIIAITCAPRFGIAMVWCAVPVQNGLQTGPSPMQSTAQENGRQRIMRTERTYN